MRPVPLLVPLACVLTISITLSAQPAQRPPAQRPPAASAPGQLPVLEGRPDRVADEAAGDGAPARAKDAAADPLPLGEPFRSQALGISVRPPAGFRMVRKLGGDEVDFVDEQRKWTLKVSRMQLTEPMTLEPGVDPKRDNLPRAGLLEITLGRLKAAMPAAVVLRNDVINLGANDAGLIALRHVEGLETMLSQQALVRRSDLLYFVISLTSPGSKAAGNANVAGNDNGANGGDNEPAEDRGERQAVETFQSILDTVELLDQEPLRREQDERLYATRAFYVNLGSAGKLEKALIPRQWFRILRNGKDIGYLYTVEETAEGIPGNRRAAGAAARARGKAGGAALAADGAGILVGMRSRTLPDENLQVDSESWMFCTPDRRSEQWSTLTVVRDRKAKTEDHAMTFGASSRQANRVLDKEADLRGEQWDKNDPGQPPVAIREDHRLNVTHVGKRENAEPLSQGVPKWYLPQALGHLLPRVLPLREPKQFMFAAYVHEARAVMHRYVDVAAESRVVLAGEPIRAIPIKDRIGLEGSVTTHYVTHDGKYLGSENPDGGIIILPSDEQRLKQIWKDADFTRPADVKENPEPARAAGAPANPAAATRGTGATNSRPATAR